MVSTTIYATPHSKFISTTFKTSITEISKAISQIQKIRVVEGLDGLFDTATVQQYTLAINGLNKQEAVTLLQRQGLSTAQQAQILSSAGLLQTTQMLNASLVEETVLNSKISGEKAEQVLTELGLIEAKTGNLVVTKECTVAEVAQALATKGIVGADAEAILSQLGLAGANTTATASFSGLTTAIKANTATMAKWLVTNPVGWCILAVGAIYGLTKAYDALTVSEEEMAEAHEESVQKVKDSISEYEELKQELETIQQTYDDNEQKLKDLYKLRENQTITQAEKDYFEELEGQNEKLRQQIEYKQTLADIEAKEAEDEAVKTLNEKTQDDLTTRHSNDGGATVESNKITDAEKIKQNTGTINRLTSDLLAYEKAIKGVALSQEEIANFSATLENLYEYERVNGEGSLGAEAQATKEFYEALLNGTLTYEQYEKAVVDTTTKVQGLVSENDALLQTVEPLNNAIKSTTGENYELKKANDEIIANAKDAAIGFKNYTNSVNETTEALNSSVFTFFSFDQESFNDQIKSYESGYQKLLDVKEEWDSSKSISAESFADLQSSRMLEYLEFTADGLQINSEKLLENAQSCKDKAVADLHAAMTSDMLAIAIGDTSNISETAQSVIEQLGNNAEIAGDKALSSVSDWATLGATISQVMADAGVEGISVDQRKQMSAVYDYYKNMASSISKIDITTSVSKNAKESAKDAEKAIKDYVKSYMDYMKASLDASKIDYQTYSREVSAFLKKMFDEGKIAAKDYHDYTKEMLEVQLDIYDKALNAVTRRIQKEIDGINDIIDGLKKQNELYEKQLEEMEGALSVVDDVYQSEIDALEEQKQLLQDRIDAINDANDALDLQYRKEQALIALQNAQNNRVKKVYTGDRGFIYETDQSAIRDAKADLKDIETEELISNIEREQDAIDSEIETLEKYRDLWAEITDVYKNKLNEQIAIAIWGENYKEKILSNEIADIERFKSQYINIQDKINNNEGLIASYNEKIDYYEKLKEQYSSVADVYEQSIEDQYAAMILGQNWESDVINGRLDTLNKFKEEYIAIQKAIADAAWNSANEQNKAAQSIVSGGTTGGGGSGGNNNTTTEQPKSNDYWVYKSLGSYKSNGEASSKIRILGGDGVIKVGNEWLVIKWKKGFSSNGEASSQISALGGSGVYKRYHTGLDEGYVGSVQSDTNRLEVLQRAGEGKLLSNEVPTILENGEVVLTRAQQINIADGLLQRSFMPNINMPNYSHLESMPIRNVQPVTLNIGDIHVHKPIGNVDNLSNAIINELPNKMLQAINRR